MSHQIPKYQYFLIAFGMLFGLMIVPSQFKAYFVGLVFILLLIQRKYSFNFRFFVLNSLLYFGLLVSLLYTENIKNGMSFVFETQALLLVFPLLFAMIPSEFYNELNIKKRYFFLIFILTVFVYSLTPFSWFFSPYHYSIEGMIKHYPGILNSDDFNLFRIHPVYMAAGIAWAFILNLYIILKTNNKKIRLFLGILNIYFLVILFFLAKMTSIIALFVATFTFVYFYKHHVFYKTIPLIFVIVLTLFVLPSTRKRIDEIRQIEHKNILIKTSTGKHLRILKSSLSTFYKSPLWGYGLGSQKKYLLEEYKRKGEMDLYKEQLSTHNQYLGFLLIGGIILLALYLFMIFKSLQIALKTHNYLMVVFIVFISVILLTENYLERNTGVFVFALFFNFLNWISFQRQKFLK